MRYAEPSIIEALCEFVFVAGEPWDLTAFGRFADRFGEHLPTRDQVEVMTVDVKALPGRVEQAMVRKPRLRLFSEDRTHVAQVGENLVSANVLPPYPHWNEFRRFILETLDGYVAAAKPARIERMTLRYIDRIEPPATDRVFRLGDWIEAGSAYVPAFLADSAASATNRAEKEVDGGTEAVTVGLQTDDEARRVVMLDTELVVRDLTIDARELVVRLDVLHERVIAVFETCISQRTRQLLQPTVS